METCHLPPVVTPRYIASVLRVPVGRVRRALTAHDAPQPVAHADGEPVYPPFAIAFVAGHLRVTESVAALLTPPEATR